MNYGPKPLSTLPAFTLAYTLALILASFSVTAIRAKCVDVTEHFQWIGGIETGSADMVIRDSYAYVSTSPGLVVLDISDPAALVEVASVATPEPVRRIAISGDYVVGYWLGPGFDPEVVAIFDVSDPIEPSLVGTALFGASHPLVPVDIAIDGDIVCVADVQQLYVVDIADPTNPEITGSGFVTGEEVTGLAFSGNYAYVTDSWERGLTVFDIFDPANPTQTVYPIPGVVRNPLVAGGYLFLDDVDELFIYDLIDPAAPELILKFETIELGQMTLDGDLLYISGSSGIAIYDVSTILEPVLIGSYGHHNAFQIHVVFPYAFTPGYAVGSVYDLSVLSTPDVLSVHEVEDYSVVDVATNGEIAYVVADSSFRSQLASIDVSDPTTPVRLGSTVLPQNSENLSLDGEDVFVISRLPSTLTAFNVSVPGSPTVASTLNLPSAPYDIDTEGDVTVLATGSGLTIVNTADPLSPFVVATVPSAGRMEHVRLDGGFAYLTGNDDGLMIVDVTNPNLAKVVGSLDIAEDWPGGLDVHDGKAYVATGRAGLIVVDVSNPSAPEKTDIALTMTRATDVDIAWPFAYVGHPVASTGMQVFEITDSSNIVPLGSLGIKGRPVSSMILGDLLYSAAGDLEISGLHCSTSSVPVQGNRSFAELHTVGNPFRGSVSLRWTLAEPSQATLRVFGPDGRLIRQLFEGRLANETGLLSWDGRSDGGALVSSGSYLVQLQTNAGTVSRSVVLVR